MFYDKFGRKNRLNPSEPESYQIDEQDGCTYIRYFNTNPCAIRRIILDNTITTIEIAYGNWDNREELSYVPINDLVEVE